MKGSSFLQVSAAVGFVAGMLALGPMIRAQENVRVIDGDTIVVAGEHVRLWGIDAPESDQTCLDARGLTFACGAAATARMRELLAGKSARCEPAGPPSYGRTVARCYVGGLDIGRQMVRDGYAVDYRRYSKGAYAGDQNAAMFEKVGLWAGEFGDPRAWRAARRDRGR